MIAWRKKTMNDPGDGGTENTDKTAELIKEWQEKIPDRSLEVASETGDLL